MKESSGRGEDVRGCEGESGEGNRKNAKLGKWRKKNRRAGGGRKEGGTYLHMC